MVMRLKNEPTIEDLGNHPREAVTILRQLLAGGARVQPDPKRADFYELEHGSDVYYIHISPVTGHILLLATWTKDEREGAAVSAGSQAA